MNLISTILIALVTLGILVTVHEWGHFFVARKNGVRVLKFSIGFGPSLYSWTGKSGTEYTLAAIPLGGFVKMAGEHDADENTDIAPDNERFDKKSVGQRFAIVAAGPIVNLLLAIVIFWGFALQGEVGVKPIIGSVDHSEVSINSGLEAGQEVVAIDGVKTATWSEVNRRLLKRLGDTGEIEFSVKYADGDSIYQQYVPITKYLGETESPDPLGDLGIQPWLPKATTEIAQVVKGGAAEKAGIQVGDTIVGMNNQPVVSWQSWAADIASMPGKTVELTVKRDGLELPIKATIASVTGDDGEKMGRLGVGATPPEWPKDMLSHTQYGFIEAGGVAVKRTWGTAAVMLNSVQKMIVGDISSKNLSGPITIAKVAADSAESGLRSWLGLLALLSISLGVLNLLPIPMLDGGHLFFYCIEAIKGSPVNAKVQGIALQFGMMLILGITLLAIFNDITRL